MAVDGQPETSISITIVVAVADNGVIGSGGDMPWRMPSDLKRLRAQTMGKPLIMGRKTFQSLPRPLDGRDNIVITRDPSFRPPGALVVASLEEALALARRLAVERGTDEIVIFGGGEIYAAALPITDRVHLTRVHASLGGDTHFPELDPRHWQLVSQVALPRGPKDDHDATLQVFQRIAGA